MSILDQHSPLPKLDERGRGEGRYILYIPSRQVAPHMCFLELSTLNHAFESALCKKHTCQIVPQLTRIFFVEGGKNALLHGMQGIDSSHLYFFILQRSQARAARGRRGFRVVDVVMGMTPACPNVEIPRLRILLVFFGFLSAGAKVFGCGCARKKGHSGFLSCSVGRKCDLTGPDGFRGSRILVGEC